MKLASFAILAALLLVACSANRQAKETNFVVDTVAPHGPEQPSLRSERWPFFKQQTSHLKMCLKDRATLEPIVNEPFSWQLGKSTESRRTDVNGCVLFAQTTAYNELATETYVTQEGLLSGEGRYQGARRVQLGVNPWGHALLDLSVHRPQQIVPVEEAHDALLGQKRFDPEVLFKNRREEPHSNLFVDKIKLAFSDEIHSKTGSTLRYQLQLAPKFKHKLLDGKFATDAIAYGKFRGRVSLWQAGPTGLQLLAATPEAREMRVAEGRVVIENLALAWQGVPRAQAPLEGYLELIPVDAEGGLLPFYGRFQVASSALRQTVDAEFSQMSAAAIAEFARQLPLNPTPPKELSGFVVASWSAQPAPDSAQVDSDTHRALVKTSVDFCLKSAIDNRPVGQHTFKVSLEDAPRQSPSNTAVTVQTDADGCVRPQSNTRDLFSIQFPYYGRRQYLTKYLVISSETAPFEGRTESVALHVNPWFTEASRFFWSPKQGEPGTVVPPTKTAEIGISRVETYYPDQRTDYELDTQMNLIQKEGFSMSLYPEILWHAEKGEKGARADLREAPRPGMKFRMRTVLTSSQSSIEGPEGFLGNLHYVSGFESIVTTEAFGNQVRLNAPMILAHEFHEGLLFRNFLRIFVEITPVSPQSELRGITLMMDLDPRARRAEVVPQVSPLAVDVVSERVLQREGGAEFELAPLELGTSLSNNPHFRFENARLVKPKRRMRSSPLEHFVTEAKFRNRTQFVDLEAARPHWPAEFTENQRLGKTFQHLLQNPALVRAPAPPDGRSDTDSIYKQVAIRYCSLYTNSTEDLRRCERGADTFRYVRMHLFEFVDRVESAPRPLEIESGRLEIRTRSFSEKIRTVRVMEGKNDSENYERGYSVRMGLDRLGIGGGLFNNYAQRNQSYWATEMADTKDVRERVEAMRSRPFQFTAPRFHLDLTVRSCALIVPGPSYVAQANDEDRRYLVCTGPIRRQYEDSWYSLAALRETEGASLTQLEDPRSRMLRFFRSDGVFQVFQWNLDAYARGFGPSLSQGTGTQGPTHWLNQLYERMQNESPFRHYVQVGGIFPGIGRYRPIPMISRE